MKQLETGGVKLLNSALRKCLINGSYIQREDKGVAESASAALGKDNLLEETVSLRFS